MSLEGAIAAHRFGLGARPGEIERASRDPRNWLLTQLNGDADPPTPLDGGTFKTGGQLVADLIKYQRERAMDRRMGTGGDPVKMFFQVQAKQFLDELSARYAHGFTTERPFAERLVWFWSNHFVVSAMNPRATTLVCAFEREAIRPHITGTFEDMTLAAMSHPAMLLYLDNAQSIGPDSLAGKFTGKGRNENLGRELMELYTLGVDGGYTQADVIAHGQHPDRLVGQSERPQQRLRLLREPPRAGRDHACAAVPIPPTFEGGVPGDQGSRQRSGDSAPHRQEVRDPFHRRRPAGCVRRAAGEDVQGHPWRSARAGAHHRRGSGGVEAAAHQDAHAGRICDGGLSLARSAQGSEFREAGTRCGGFDAG